jgi:hypothetical protein
MKLPYDQWNDELNGVRPDTSWPFAIAGFLAFMAFCGWLLWRV